MSSLSPVRVFKAYLLAFTTLGSYLSAWALGKSGIRSMDSDAWLSLHQRNAKRIVGTFSQLRGIYIKIGQSLSIMSNFLPEALTQGLESLQDQAPPTPAADIERMIAREFGKRTGDIFATFNPQPLASASLGQVHEATLVTGEKVAVKIQHPYVETLVHKDLKTLKKIFGLFHIAFPYYGIKNVYRECAAMIRQELDFRQEGKNSELVARNLEDMKNCIVPKVYWDYSTSRILTTQFMPGIKINRLNEAPPDTIDSHEVAVILLNSYCRQIFENGLYHADPHPGNLLVQPGPRLVFLDFGATAKISDRMRAGITHFVKGMIHKDTKLLTEALKQMGFVAKGDKDEASERIVEHFYSKITALNIENFKDIQSIQTMSTLIDPTQLDFSFKELATTFHIPREWILLERTLLLIMGLCATLDPTLNPIRIVMPYVETFVLGKDQHFQEFLLSMVKEAGSSYLTLGLKLDHALKKLDRGDLSVNVKLGPAIEKELRAGIRLLAATAVLCTSLFLLATSNPSAELARWQPFLAWTTGISAAVSVYYLFVKPK